MVTARIEIGRLQRRLWERQKRLIAAAVSGAGPALRAYERRYLRRTREHLREASLSELVETASRADVVYVGDYHTLRRSQRSFLTLVQRRTSTRPLVLALEFVQGRHQRSLDAWLAGRLSEARFLEAIQYRRHAVFDTWPNFRPVLAEARRLRLPVIALDLLDRPLADRDRFAAALIAGALERAPQAQIFALAGQLHVAPPHLPAAVDRELLARGLPRRHPLVVYQNCERIWWALQRDGRELEVEAAVIRPGEWCLINTPPVVVQQSFLDWVEGGGEPLDANHLESRFRLLARSVARFLGVDGPALRDALGEVAVYTAGDLSFLPALAADGFSSRDIRLIERQILSRESYYIPRARIAYLANLSLNHAAEEAAHFVRSVVSGAGDEPRPLADAFYARTLEEAYAYCGSKIVNARRRCPMEPEMERLARSPDPLTRDMARIVLRHRRIERGARGARALSQAWSMRDSELFNAVTHSLGYMLGERLYRALATGRMLKREVRALFLDPLSDEGAPFLTYLGLSRRLEDVRIPPRS